MSVQEALTMREAAERLGVSHDKIYRMVKTGELKAEVNPLDRREKLILLSDIERFLTSMQPSRPRFLSDGVADVEDAIPSDQIKQWIRANWRPDLCAASVIW